MFNIYKIVSLFFCFILIFVSSYGQDINNKQGVDYCHIWFSGHHDAFLEGEVHIIASNTICFDGNLSTNSAEKLVQAIKSLDPDKSVTLIVRSIGGDAVASLSVGSLLASRNSTVFVDTLCASSCANYIFLMAKKRIIGPSAIVGFHGGLSPRLIDRGITAMKSFLKTNESDTRVQEETQRLTYAYNSQVRILKGLGIRDGFIEWYDIIPSHEYDKYCPERKEMIVFSPYNLMQWGIEVERNDGPKNAADLIAATTKLHAPELACFWGS